MNDTGLFNLEFHATLADITDCLGHFERDGARLRVWHEPSRAQHLPELSYVPHHVRGGDGLVELQPAAFDLLHEVVAADDFSPRVPGLFFLLAFGEDQDPHLDACAMRQHNGSPHHLIGSLRIDAETKSHFDRFIKLGIRRALHQFYSFLQAIQLVAHRCFRCLPLLAHLPSEHR